MKCPSVLVTGTAGFVGQALCQRLATEGCEVRYTVRTPSRQGSTLFPGMEQVAVGNIGPETDWSKALHGVDTVVHLAARVHQMNDHALDPLSQFRLVNAAGTEHLARMAAIAGVKRFVFVSSVKVHGEESAVPYVEESPFNPGDPYGISKMEAERMLRNIEAETGLGVVVIRPPLVYGPGAKANFLELLKVLRLGIPIPFSSIRNRRSLVYVGNLVDALALSALHPAAAGQTFLVSDGDDVSTPELLRRTGEALGQPARLFPFPPSFMRLAGRLLGKTAAVERLLGSLVVDSSKIRRELGWTPPFTMDEGLKATADWFKHEKSL